MASIPSISAQTGSRNDASATAVPAAASGLPTVVTQVFYNASNGDLTLSGSNFSLTGQSFFTSDFKLTGYGGNTYTLGSTSSVLGTPSASSVTLQLSAADQLAVNGLFDQNGTAAADTAGYNLHVPIGWDGVGSIASAVGVTVTGSNPPLIASVQYDAGQGIFTVGGSNLTDYAGINVGNFTFSDGAGNSYSFDPTSDTVTNLTAGGFTLTLSANDQTTVNAFVTQAGAAYTLAAGTGWDDFGGADIAAQPVTAVDIPPAITAAAYNAASGQLTLTGSYLTTAAGDYHPADIDLLGDGGNDYLLSSGTTVVGTPTAGSVTLQLSTADQLAVNGLLNLNGTAAVDGSSYDLTTNSGWDGGTSAAIDVGALTVSNLTAPTISAVQYDAGSGVITVSGSHLTNYGSTPGINLDSLTLNGDGQNNYSFDPGSDTISNFTANGFSIQLSAADNAAVDGVVVTANGNKGQDGTPYTLSANAGWDGDSGAAIVAQSFVASGVVPSLIDAAYDASTGQLTLDGNLLTFSAAGYHVGDFTFSGDGGHAYTLTAGSKVIAAPSSGNETLIIQLSAADQFAIDGLFNNSGNNANDGTAFNLSAAAGWDTAAVAVSTMAVTVSNVTPPTIWNVAYDAGAGVFTVSGNNLVNAGSANGINLADFSFTGANGGSYTFNPTLDSVAKLTATGFSIKLGGNDIGSVAALVDNNGSNSRGGTAYALHAAANWDSDFGAAIGSQAVTVSNGTSSVSNVAYNAANGQLTITGSFLTAKASDYKVHALTLTGDGGGKYQLGNASKVIGTPGSSGVTIQLSAADQLAVAGLLNRDGTQAVSGTAYGLTAKAGWDTHAAHALTAAAVTVGNAGVPALAGVYYDAGKGVFTFTGSGFSKHGSANGIVQTAFGLVTGNAGSYTFTAKDKVGQSNGDSFTITLSGKDKALVNALATGNGQTALDGKAYQIDAAAGWDSDTGTAVTGQAVSVSGAATVLALAHQLSHPAGLAVDSAGNLFVADTRHAAIKELAAGGNSLTSVAAIAGGQPAGLAVDHAGNLFYSDTANNTVAELVAGTATPVQIATGLSAPAGMAVDTGGNLYVADGGNGSIVEIAAGSHDLKTLVSGLTQPAGVAVDAAGDLFFTTGGGSVQELPAGAASAASAVTLATGFKQPDGIAVDGSGDVYVADAGHGAVKEIVAGSGSVVTIATGLGKPQALAIDAGGNLFVSNANGVQELAHALYPLNTPLAASQPIVIGSLWENTGQIELSKSVFTAFAGASTVTAANFSNAAAPTGGSDYLYYNARNGGVYYDAAGSTTEIAVVGAHNHPAALSAGDFKLIA